jgi:hypothetical protein
MVTEPQTSRRSSRPLLRILGIIVVVVLALAALNAAAWALRSTERDTIPIDDTFDRVEVDVSAGRITVEASADGSASLTAETEAALFASADVSHEVVDGRLVVSGDCDRGIWLVGGFNCSTDVTLQVPADVDVVATSSAGAVTARGLTGGADVRSSAGRVRVEDHSGALRAHSSAGGVTVTGLSSDDAEITSSAGGVEVTAVTPPAALLASSSAGGVTVTLPGDVAYNLEADTSAGSTTVDVATDPSSPYRVEARSSAGSVTVRPG